MDNVTEKIGGEIRDEESALRYFQERLDKTSPDVKARYSGILLSEQIRLAKENKGRPVKIPAEEREHLLTLVIRGYDVDTIKMARKMERDWNAATSKDGRPPIGGAKDD
jgi:hypothetical protein